MVGIHLVRMVMLKGKKFQASKEEQIFGKKSTSVPRRGVNLIVLSPSVCRCGSFSIVFSTASHRAYSSITKARSKQLTNLFDLAQNQTWFVLP